jgi:hypothetical protein
MQIYCCKAYDTKGNKLHSKGNYFLVSISNTVQISFTFLNEILMLCLAVVSCTMNSSENFVNKRLSFNLK